MLGVIARILRRKRIEMGALTLASPEVRFKLDAETHNPTDVCMYALKEANALVEEWMLLANITVSKQILRHYPTLGILRRHQPPTREQFAPLLAAAGAVGVHLDISSSKTLADSLDAAVRPNDPYFNKLLRILSTRCMMPAQYFCSGEIPKEHWHHYGLAAPVYTHFTSPIRRYADILVHRLLAASIGVIALPPQNADRGKQQDTCAHMNRRHRAAQHVQRASVQLHTLVYFAARPSVEEAYVLGISAHKFTVMIPRFGIEGSIEWDVVKKTLPASELSFDSVLHRMTLYDVHRREIISLQVFGRVQIAIRVRCNSDVQKRKLCIALVHNGRELDEEAERRSLNESTDVL
jgi:exosome complex exonuclease DIS3/RRP44